MEKALIYARVSTDEQAQEGKSIETQSLQGEKFINSKGDLLEEICSDEGRSGSDMNRPGLRRLLERCKVGDISYVVVQDIDRISRDTFDYLFIKKKL